MMGHGHASSGLCAGLVLGDSLALGPAATITLGLAGAGAAVLPDIDCAGSTASTVFGPFSQVVHHGSVGLHNMVAASLTTGHEKHSEHRGLTHWWPFWIVSGLGVWALCSINQWCVMAVLAVLFALAARGLTIPDLPAETQGRFEDSLRHQIMMRKAYQLLWLCPFTWAMRAGRKHVNKSRRYSVARAAKKAGYAWLGERQLLERVGFRLGLGKMTVAGVAAAVAWFLTTQTTTAAQLGPWLGLLVGAGMLLHWVGDCPTHMGVPGLSLFKFWKLPFWASFYAGGPFEIMVLWFPLGWLNTLMVPGLLPHVWEMTIATYVGITLGVIIAILIIVEATQIGRRRYTTT